MIDREQRKTILDLYGKGKNKTTIARVAGVSRPTVDKYIKQEEERKARQRKREVEKTLKEVVREELNRRLKRLESKRNTNPYFKGFIETALLMEIKENPAHRKKFLREMNIEYL